MSTWKQEYDILSQLSTIRGKHENGKRHSVQELENEKINKEIPPFTLPNFLVN